MLISVDSYNRYLLSKEEKIFFKKLVPLVYIINEWTIAKAQFLGLNSHKGVLPSILITDILLSSNYGKEPVSQEDCLGKYSNNLALLESDSRWSGKSNIYKDKSYKAFKNYRFFAEEYSDYLTFSREFDNLLISTNIIDQAAHLTLGRRKEACYSSNMIATINKLGLQEIDAQTKR